MKRVKCKSGIEGWQCRLRENYENDFEQFKGYCESHNVAGRLGFESAEKAWEVNPIIQGSVEPSDLRVVLGEFNTVDFVNDEVKELFSKFLSGKIDKDKLINKLNAIDNRLKRLFGSPNKQSFWFRLFKGETMAHDAYKLSSYLSDDYTIESMKLGVEKLGIECYYS